MEGGWSGEGRSKRSGRSGRACSGAVCHLIGSRGIGPGQAMGPGGVGRRSMDTLGAMAPGGIGPCRPWGSRPWGHGGMGPGAMQFEGHGMEGGANRAGGAGGHALGPFKVI